MADPITAIVTAVVKIGAAIVAAYKASVVVRVAIHIAAMIAVSVISQALAAKPGKINQGQELSLKLDPTMPRQVLVGQTATGGSQVWGFTYGSTNDVPNRYLVRIIQLSDRPCSGFVKALAGDETLTFAGDPTQGLVACNQYKNKKGVPCMHMQIVLGSDNPTVPAWLISASGGLWTSNHKGTGLCYAIVRYDYDPDAFPNGEPEVAWIMKGAKLYDERHSTDEGGTQVWGTPSTYEYSENASVIAANILRGFYTKNSLILGAQAIDRDFELASNIAAHNTCDQTVSLAGGGTEQRYTAHTLLTATDTVSTMLQDMKAAMDGDIFDRGGRICLLPGAIRTPVLDLDDDDIDWSAEKSYQPVASLSSLYNRVTGNYVPKALNYVQDAYPIQRSAAYEVQDGGERIALTQDFRAVTSDGQVQRITMRLLKASRFQNVVAFTGPLWLYEIQQGDWFTLTSARWNMTSKYFKAVTVTLTPDLKVVIVATETSPVVDGWSPADEVPRTSTGYTPNPYVVNKPSLIASGTLVEDPSNSVATKLPGIEVLVAHPEGSVGVSYTIQYKKTGQSDAEARILGYMDRNEPWKVFTEGVLNNTSYQVRGWATDASGTPSDPTAWDEATTPDVYTVKDSNGMGGIEWQQWWEDLTTAGQLPIVDEVPTEYIEGAPVIYNETDGKIYRWDPNTNAYVKEVSATDIDGALTSDNFPQDLRPLERVSTLPTTGNFQGRQVFLTTNNKVYRYTGSAWTAATDAADISGSLGANQIANGAITLTKFANGLKPVEVVSSLPTSGNTEGRIVTLTTDGKLYRYHNGAWTSAVSSADIAGQLTSEQIAAIAATKISGQLTNDQIADIAAAKLTGQVVATQIANGAVTATKFATGLRPVEVVSSLPSSGNTEGRTVMLTTNGKLYRYYGGAWTSTVASSDVTGTLTNEQIADLAASKITGQIVSSQVSNGAITDAKIAGMAASKIAGQLTDAQIAAVAASKISGTLTNAQIADLAAAKLTGQITETQITDNAITSAKISAGAVVAGKIASNAVTADKITAGAITATKLMIGDTSNIYPDPEMVDAAFYSPGWVSEIDWTLEPGEAAGATSKNHLKIGPGTNPATRDYDVFTGAFPVEPGKPLYLSIRARTAGAGGSPNQEARAYIYWYTGEDLTSSTTQRQQIVSVTNGVRTETQLLTVPSDAKRARIRFYRIRNADLNTVYFDSIIIRRAANSELIVDGAIIANKIASNAVTSNKIIAGAITAAKIAAGAIETDKLAAGAVVADKLASNSVTSDKIVANAVTAGKLAADSVAANNIVAGAITATKLMVADTTNLYGDPTFADPNYLAFSDAEWAIVSTTSAALNSSVSLRTPYGNGTTSQATSFAYQFGQNNYLMVEGQSQLRVSMNYHASTGFTGQQYIAIYWFDGKGALLSATPVNSYTPFPDFRTSPPSSAQAGSVTFDVDVPAGAVYGQMRFYVRWSTTLPNTQSAYFSQPRVMRKAEGSLIVDGSIITDKLAANAVTTDKVTAGAVTTGLLAAGSVTASKLFIGDTTNMFPDPDLVDSSLYYQTGGAVWGIHPNDYSTGLRRLRIAYNGGSNSTGVWGPVIPLEKTTPLFVGAYYGVGGSAPHATATLWVVYYSDRAATAQISSLVLPAHGTIGWRTTFYGEQVPVPSNAKAMRLVFIRNGLAGSDSSESFFSTPTIRYATTGELIVDGAIIADKIAANAVTADKIVAGAVTSDKIVANAVTAVKIDAGAITTGKIAAGAVTADQIAANAVTAVKIAANQISATHIIAGTITANELASNSVVTGKVAAGAITTTELAAGAVTANKIAANAITATHIGAGTITGDRLVVGTISSAYLAAGSIVASKLLVGDTSNMFPDPLFADVEAYASSNVFWSVIPAYETFGSKVLNLPGSTAGNTYLYTDNLKVAVEPSQTYLLKCTVEVNSSGNQVAEFGVKWFDASGAFLYNVPAGTYTSTTPGTLSAKITAPTNAKFAAPYFLMLQGNSGPRNGRFGDVVMRRAADGELIVDGAITASKIATNAITADKIVAGAVTAAKIAVSTLSAITANIGTVTAGLLRNAQNTMQLDLSNSRIVFNNGTVMKVQGLGFGVNNRFLEWYGPSMSISACSESNAIQYLTVDGQAYLRGTFFAGTLSNSGQGSNTQAPVEIVVGPFSTNGNPIAVAYSYSYQRLGKRWGDQRGGITGTTTATLRLYRKIGNNAETLIATRDLTGGFTVDWDSENQPGQPAGTFGTTSFQEDMFGSWTYTDTAGGTDQRTYRWALETRTVRSVPGNSPTADGVIQNYSVVTSEN